VRSTFSTTRLDLCRGERTELSGSPGSIILPGAFFQFPTFICRYVNPAYPIVDHEMHCSLATDAWL
jgi:hypothetical protein